MINFFFLVEGYLYDIFIVMIDIIDINDNVLMFIRLVFIGGMDINDFINGCCMYCIIVFLV